MKLGLSPICLVIGCLALTTAAAQQSATRRPQRVPATIVLTDFINQRDASWVIVRRPGGVPADVILLRSGASVDELSEAIRGLMTARYANGDVAPAAATFRVRPRTRAGADARPALPWAPRVLNDLRRAQLREVSGFGRVRAVEIWLPRQGNGRATRRS
jgi:hypothetical protein